MMLTNNGTGADSDQPNSNTKNKFFNGSKKMLDSKNRKSKKRFMSSSPPDNIENSNAKDSNQNALTINGIKSVYIQLCI